jgi:hypothetical protein
LGTLRCAPSGDASVNNLGGYVFPDYTREAFEKKFRLFFNISASEKIPQSERILYLMHKKEKLYQ